AGQIPAPTRARPGDTLAARLAAEVAARLVHDDLVAPLDELVRRAQARHSSTKDCDCLSHDAPLSRSSPERRPPVATAASRVRAVRYSLKLSLHARRVARFTHMPLSSGSIRSHSAVVTSAPQG